MSSDAVASEGALARDCLLSRLRTQLQRCGRLNPVVSTATTTTTAGSNAEAEVVGALQSSRNMSLLLIGEPDPAQGTHAVLRNALCRAFHDRMLPQVVYLSALVRTH